jgi:hypothetical protein
MFIFDLLYFSKWMTLVEHTLSRGSWIVRFSTDATHVLNTFKRSIVLRTTIIDSWNTSFFKFRCPNCIESFNKFCDKAFHYEIVIITFKDSYPHQRSLPHLLANLVNVRPRSLLLNASRVIQVGPSARWIFQLLTDEH